MPLRARYLSGGHYGWRPLRMGMALRPNNGGVVHG